MPLKICFALVCLVAAAGVVYGQKADYVLVNRSIKENGKGEVHLSAAEGDGIAWIKGQELTEGVIEFDVKGKDVLQQSFVGFAFHGVNDTTFEVVYFRPFNFRSPDPVRTGHAVQYVALPGYDWQTLREKFPNKYEQPVSPAPDPNDWFHARIVVGKEKIEVYVNGAKLPSLVVAPPLVHTNGRMVGYWVGNGSDGDWKNLQISQGAR
jgi:hypothetical protein